MSFRVVIAAALAALLATSLVPRTALAADDAAALLAKHHAYAGWASGDGVVKTLRETGTVTNASAKVVEKIRMLRFGVAYRASVQDARGFEEDDGFTGSVLWTTAGNGFIIRPVGDSARFLIDQHALFGELTAGYTPSVLRHEAVGGVDTVVLRLTHQVGYPMDVYVDPASGAFKRAVIDPGGKFETAFDGLEYTEVQGKRFLSAWRHAGSKYTHRYDKIDVNPEIAADALRPPKQSATWTFGDGTVPIELRVQDALRIYVDVTMNGVKGRFMFDTGAAGTLISNDFARRIGAKRAGKSEAYGIGGAVSGSSLYQVDSVQVGKSTLHNLMVSSGADEDDGGEKIVGMIGFDLLGGAIVELDFDRKTLEVLDPAKVAPDQSRGLVLHPDLTTGLIRVPMQLNGKLNVLATLDSGNPVNVLLPKDLVHQNRVALVADPNQGSLFYGGGVGANYEIERCGMMGSLTLGPIEYKPVPACDSDYMQGNEILVGLDFMKAFNYVFDYPDGIVLLMKRKG
ncbi:MAG TPA: retropepsin-like aspartic protease [Candidatus Elarobacter sp.]|jgi:predicted aspartyl protease